MIAPRDTGPDDADPAAVITIHCTLVAMVHLLIAIPTHQRLSVLDYFCPECGELNDSCTCGPTQLQK